jgi:hypothetical protein
MKCPCDGCVPPKRQLHCHSTCKDYIDWQDWKKQVHDNRRKILDEDNFHRQVAKKRYSKK